MTTKTKKDHLTAVLRSLKRNSDVIGLLEASGVDIDRLISISNAQGPLAKVIHAAIFGLSEDYLHIEDGPLREVGFGTQLLQSVQEIDTLNKGKSTSNRKLRSKKRKSIK